MSDLETLWGSGQWNDIALQTQGGELLAHRVVLAARSPVFERMLNTGMAERVTGVIKITDVSFPNLQRLCRFMYTGTVSDDDGLWDNVEAACGLFQAAAKYEVLGLVRICASKVAAMVTVDNVADLLMLALRIGPQADTLKARAMQFITGHLSYVQVTLGWQRLMQDTRLVSEMAPLLFQMISPPAKRRRTTKSSECQV